jgi:hypothetical protein
VRAESRVFGAARAAEKTGCQRRLTGYFYQHPKIIMDNNQLLTHILAGNLPNQDISSV